MELELLLKKQWGGKLGTVEVGYEQDSGEVN